MLKDLKESLSSTRKPDISHVRYPFMVYTGRQCAYGNAKYVRANFMRPVSPDGYTGTPTRADLLRFQSYLRAAASHAVQTLDAIEQYLSEFPPDAADDVEAMKAAAYAVDVDPDPSGKVPPSFMPHVAGSCASLNMAITQAVKSGLLPADPGEPWADATCVSKTANDAREAWRRSQGIAELNALAMTKREERHAFPCYMTGKVVRFHGHPVTIAGRQDMYYDVEWYAGDVLQCVRCHVNDIVDNIPDAHVKLHVVLRRPPYRTYEVPVLPAIADAPPVQYTAGDAVQALDKELADDFSKFSGRARTEGVDQ